MKLTTGILAMTLMAGGASAQNPNIIANMRGTMQAVPQKQANDSHGAPGAQAPVTKPAPGAPAPAVKPVIIPASKAAATKAPPKPAAQPAGQRGELKRVNVVQGKEDVRIEIASHGAVTPTVSTLKSPARVVVDLPETVMATAQSHITVGSSGVKGVRIGMDGKTPPTTHIVVDLEKACTYELSAGSEGKTILILHTGVAAASAPASAKPAPALAAKVVAKPAVAPAAKSNAAAVPAPKIAPAPKIEVATGHAAAATPKVAVAAKTATPDKKQQAGKGSKPVVAMTIKPTADASKHADAGQSKSQPKPQAKPEEKKWAMSGKRDPFFSPVVQQTGGSGCSTGKKCLEIGQINLKGVVKSDAGFIAVVTNSLNKAYFLRENDPVFNGYVVRITGDSVVFQETVQDKLGKPFTREVTKRIFTPAV
jgi:hypothetical protein